MGWIFKLQQQISVRNLVRYNWIDYQIICCANTYTFINGNQYGRYADSLRFDFLFIFAHATAMAMTMAMAMAGKKPTIFRRNGINWRWCPKHTHRHIISILYSDNNNVNWKKKKMRQPSQAHDNAIRQCNSVRANGCGFGCISRVWIIFCARNIEPFAFLCWSNRAEESADDSFNFPCALLDCWHVNEERRAESGEAGGCDKYALQCM